MNEKVLIYCNSDEERKNLCDLLEKGDYNVLEAIDETSAFETAAREIPDLIIAHNGCMDEEHSLFNKIRNERLTSTVPFICIAEFSTIDELREILNRGVDDCIQIPVCEETVLQTVNANINKFKKFDYKLNQLKDSIALYIPHELRTPLASILGYTELLKEELKDVSTSPTVQWIINSIYDSGIRLNEVVNKFIKYAEITAASADQTTIKKLRDNLIVSAEVSIRLISHKIAVNYKRENDLEFEINDASLKMIPSYFELIVEELIQNAFKYSKLGSKVKIFTERSGRMFIMQITDNGIGMTPDQINRVSAFTQFDRNRNEIEGNGLGLITIKKIIAMYDGTFYMQSEPQRYTRITVGLPI
ncbi:MAG: hypothetical protein KF816_01470 [Melioribacteraceae bacterium]|jgi:signal transduction histidine kinase|nr:hypothetical protein [Melioribacteraceae bacterium]